MQRRHNTAIPEYISTQRLLIPPFYDSIGLTGVDTSKKNSSVHPSTRTELRIRHTTHTPLDMPPPHLHPRSRMTSSLFATTVFASFFVVVLPHVLPCPAPRVALADGQMVEVAADGTVLPQQQQQQQRRRRRRRLQDEVMCPSSDAPAPPVGATQVERDADGMARFAMETSSKRAPTDNESATSQLSSSPRRNTRECPVPKPGGIVGELLGFKCGESQQHQLQSQQAQQQQSLPHPTPLEK